MRITVNNYQLLSGLKTINKIIKSNNQLSNKLLIRAQKDSVYLETSNQEKAMSIKLNAKIQLKEQNEPNEIVTTLTILTNLVAKLEVDETNIILENETLRLTNGTVNARLPLDSQSNYIMPVLNNVNGINIEPMILDKLLTNSIPFCLGTPIEAVASNQLALATINLNFENNTIQAMASNSHIGINIKEKTKYNNNLQTLNIPSDTAIIIQSLAREAEKKKSENIILKYNDTGLYVISDGIKFYSRMLNAKFPPLDKVMKNKGQNIITINRERLLKTAERMICFVEKDYSCNPIILELNNKKADISIKSALGKNNEELSIETNNDNVDFRIGINSSYLIKTLKTATTDNIQFYIQSNIHPLIITSDETEFVISPLKIREKKKDTQAA